MLSDCFKANLGVKDLPRLGIEPQSPSPQPVFIYIIIAWTNPIID